MDFNQLHSYCLSLPHTEETFPFDQDTLVFKVGGKMFALTSLEKWELGLPSINLKCDPERVEDLREQYEAITPGYHMSKKHWNTVALHSDVQDPLLKELINHSYELVLSGLSKKDREALNSK